MVVTILLLGGASLALEYALLEVAQRSENLPESESGGILYVDKGKASERAKGREVRDPDERRGEDPTGLVASLVEEYPSNRRRVARKLARIGSPSAVDALVELCTGEEDAVQRELILGALVRFPLGRDGIRRLADDPRFEGRDRARKILEVRDEDR